MYQKTVAALSERVAPYVALSNDRRETLSHLTLGLLSARTTNLSVLAAERVKRSYERPARAAVSACILRRVR